MTLYHKQETIPEIFVYTSSHNQFVNYVKMHLQIRRLLSKICSLTDLQLSPTDVPFRLKQVKELVLLLSNPSPPHIVPLSRSPMKNETQAFLLLENPLSYSLNDEVISAISTRGVQPNINVVDFTYAVQEALS